MARYRQNAKTMSNWRVVLQDRARDLWRYSELLPPVTRRLTLGEGCSPLLQAPEELRSRHSLRELTFKWEGTQPTGSFKARGMSVAISRAVHFGVERLVVPTAGNAGVAAAAYAREAGVRLDVFMPKDTDLCLSEAASALGATVHHVDGLLPECGRQAARLRAEGAWDLSTLKEPYRLEGKKTMGFELWEQGPLPDVIVYPTGGGTGLVGMWKAFAELREMGLIEGRRPRMVSVQMEGCAPICRAFAAGDAAAAPWEHPATDVLGLRVPQAVGDVLILRALRESGGLAVSVSEQDAFVATQEINDALGIDAAPEAGAAFAALAALRRLNFLKSSDAVTVFLTGSGEYYRQVLAKHGVRAGFPRVGTA